MDEIISEYISVIVPVYKIEEQVLRKCIESLLNQTNENYEIILVDDGSPDNCGKVCDEYRAKSNKISVIHQKNQGVSVARNTGMDAARGGHIAFVDPDDWIEKDTIQSVIDAIHHGAKDADIIMYAYCCEYQDKSQPERLGVATGFCEGTLLAQCQAAPFYRLISKGKTNSYSLAAIWNKVYKRDFILRNSLRYLPEARKGQDRIFNTEALSCTDKLYYLDQILYHYRCNKGSVTNRYNEKIVELTKIEINEMQGTIARHHLAAEITSKMNCRICTRLYSCMRLYFFNKKNPLSSKERMEEFRNTVAAEPFASAIKNADGKYFSASERLFVFLLRNKMFLLCQCLVRVRTSIFEHTLNKVSHAIR